MCVLQGSETVFLPLAKNDFPVGAKGQETLPGIIFEKK
jgi:hypothetical protein